MIIHIDSSTAEIVDDILTRASEVSAPLREPSKLGAPSTTSPEALIGNIQALSPKDDQQRSIKVSG
jgi:hypothetical protein